MEDFFKSISLTELKDLLRSYEFDASLKKGLTGRNYYIHFTTCGYRSTILPMADMNGSIYDSDGTMIRDRFVDFEIQTTIPTEGLISVEDVNHLNNGVHMVRYSFGETLPPENEIYYEYIYCQRWITLWGGVHIGNIAHQLNNWSETIAKASKYITYVKMNASETRNKLDKITKNKTTDE